MVTTRNGALKHRRVTRSMATSKAGSSGIVKQKATSAPKEARSNTASKKNKTFAPTKRAEAEETIPEQISDENFTARPNTRSMAKETNLTKPTSSKPSSRLITIAASAARPTTRSMTINNRDTARTAASEPPTQAETNLTTAPRHINRQRATQTTLPTWTTTNVAPVDDVQARPDPSVATTPDPPRTRCVNARIMITPRGRFVRSEPTAQLTEGQWRYMIARTRASLRRALEGDQEWPDLSHGQRREMIRMFAWVESEPGRTHHDYFDLPVRHEALTTRPMVDMSGYITRVRTWYKTLKTGTNNGEAESTEDGDEDVIEED
ncbi:hypothetical protein KCU81_g7176, partial [Aureobasidium melanogenum]|uniref:Uncharacterized protein n=1 Tax=Aureobasidium melanogenum (strain CBS 110374) TaxID=1043003 RepID=A0A074VE55_AURM1